MKTPLPGIHHITAFAGEAQQHVDFYADLLGLRLVKVTINFDDPSVYHTYFGDFSGTPGTLITFFPITGALPGKRGGGEVQVTQFATGKGTIGQWQDRLLYAGVNVQDPTERFGDLVLPFTDSDGMGLEIVEPSTPDPREAWTGGPLSPEMTLRGFHAVSLASMRPEETLKLLTEGMGFAELARNDERVRLKAQGGNEASLVDLLLDTQALRRQSAGSVHHVAWRTPDDEEQILWREKLATRGLDATTVQERNYFRSIYFREPGGILFEIATDAPGFTVDEPLETLGQELKLPEWLESRRNAVRSKLPSFTTPAGVHFP